MDSSADRTISSAQAAEIVEDLARKNGPALLRVAAATVGEADSTAIVLRAFEEFIRRMEEPPTDVAVNVQLLRLVRQVAAGWEDASTNSAAVESRESAFAASMFEPPGDRWEGHWHSPPSPWPESRLRRAGRVVDGSLRHLSPIEAQVVILRDCEGWSSADVCAALEITPSVERATLHAARMHVVGSVNRWLERRRRRDP